MSAVILDTSGPDVLSNAPVVVLDQTTHVTVTLESVRLAVTLTFGERDVPVCAAMTVVDQTKPVADTTQYVIIIITGFTEGTAQIGAVNTVLSLTKPVTVTLGSVIRAVVLANMEVTVSFNAEVAVLGLTKPVTVTIEHVISVPRAFMEGLAQITAMKNFLDLTTSVVASMDSVNQAVILDIGEAHVHISAQLPVVAQIKPVTVTVEPVLAVTLDISEPTFQILAVVVVVGQNTTVTLTPDIAIVVVLASPGPLVKKVSTSRKFDNL